MGVDYFNCGECGTILCDGGGYETFEIEGMDTVSVCEYCGEQLRSKLTLIRPWTKMFLAVIPLPLPLSQVPATPLSQSPIVSSSPLSPSVTPLPSTMVSLPLQLPTTLLPSFLPPQPLQSQTQSQPMTFPWQSPFSLPQPQPKLTQPVVMSGKRVVCNNLKQAKELLKLEPQTKFGLYKSGYGLDNQKISAWTGIDCIGDDSYYRSDVKITSIEQLTEQDIVPTPTDPTSGPSYHKTKYIGWYDNNHINEFPFWYTQQSRSYSYDSKQTTDMYFHTGDTRRDGEQILTMDFIKKYAQTYNLVHTPIMVTTNERLIKLFCDPNSIDAYWFDCLEDADLARRSPKYITSNSGIHWSPTKDYIDEKVASLQQEIDEREATIASLLSIDLDYHQGHNDSDSNYNHSDNDYDDHDENNNSHDESESEEE